MATLAELQARKAALETALASGYKTVSSDGESVSFRSIEEIKAALAEVNKDLLTASNTARRKRIYVAGGRGY